ncbi:MAG: EAL domain-containing protein [Gammaproteobacteria bacterium]|nr:EAL domain-containing protein [Gammaproteobacteria bacterium]
MTLTRGLFGLIVAPSFVVVMGVSLFAIHYFGDSLQSHLNSGVEDAAISLQYSLAPALLTGDLALVESAVNDSFDPRRFTHITVRTLNNEILLNRVSEANADRAPLWLTLLFSADTAVVEREIEGTVYGTIGIEIGGNPQYVYSRLRRFTRHILAWIAIGGMMMFGIAIGSAYGFKRVFHALRRQADSMLQGEPHLSQSDHGITELTETMNVLDSAARAAQERVAVLSQQRDEYENEALHDSISGLLTRDGLCRRIKTIVNSAPASSAAVLCVTDIMPNATDIDGQHLCRGRSLQIAALLHGLVGNQASAALARLDDDSYGLFVIDAEEGAAQRWGRKLEEIFSRRGYQLSIGIAASDDVTDASEFLETAEVALSQCRAAASPQWVVGSGGTEHAIDTWRERVQKGLAEQTISIDLRPVVTLRGSDTWFYDAIPRVSGQARSGPGYRPGPVIDSELAVRLDRALTELTVAHLMAKPRDRVALRLSTPSLLDPKFIARTEQLLAHLGAARRRFIVELVPFPAEPSANRWESAVQRWISIGCGLALCHFGRDIDALHYIRQIQPVYVRLDPRLSVHGSTAQTRTVLKFLAKAIHGLQTKVVVDAATADKALLDLWRGVQIDGIAGLAPSHVATLPSVYANA